MFAVLMVSAPILQDAVFRLLGCSETGFGICVFGG